ncbi:MAG: LpqB family beta-propeller domain-containing protein [Actinomycetia bacterium]|nr:LpqB family beta-propeller domain-containing protein [Actinomycetes bacterium]
MTIIQREVRRGLAMCLAAGVAAGLTGCVTIPTSGPVQEITVSAQSDQNNPPYIEPLPPAAGATPGAVLEGFLAAVSSSSPSRFDVARTFLTSEAAAAWDPNAGATIYDSAGHPPNTTATSAAVSAPLIGTLDATGHFTAAYEPDFTHDFGMVPVDGQWRISDPGPGLLLPKYLYEGYYQAVPVYFVSPDGRSLVAEQVHLNTVDATPTGAIQALLRGPSTWLSPAVSTAIPADTRLAATSVTVEGAVAQVSLDDPVAGLADDQRERMAAQILWTLAALPRTPTVTGVRITLKGGPYAIPGQDASGVLGWSQVAAYRPFPDPDVRDGFLLADARLTQLRDDQTGLPSPVPGRLGRYGATLGLRSLALSPDLTVVAAVSEDGTRLDTASLGGGDAWVTRLEGRGLTRPQIDHAGKVWVFHRSETGPVVSVCDAQACVDAPVAGLAGAEVVAFRISPDQTRIAVVTQQDGQTRFGLLRLRVLDGLVVDGWQPIPVTTSRGVIVAYRDVAWVGDTQLLVLAESKTDGYASVYLMDADGSQVESYGPYGDVDPVELAALPRTDGITATLLTGSGRVYRFEDRTRWSLAVDAGVTALAYGG